MRLYSRDHTGRLWRALVGWSVNLKDLAHRTPCSQCGEKAAEVVAVPLPRPRGVPKNPHQRMKLGTSRLGMRIAPTTAAALLAQINREI